MDRLQPREQTRFKQTPNRCHDSLFSRLGQKHFDAWEVRRLAMANVNNLSIDSKPCIVNDFSRAVSAFLLT